MCASRDTFPCTEYFSAPLRVEPQTMIRRHHISRARSRAGGPSKQCAPRAQHERATAKAHAPRAHALTTSSPAAQLAQAGAHPATNSQNSVRALGTMCYGSVSWCGGAGQAPESSCDSAALSSLRRCRAQSRRTPSTPSRHHHQRAPQPWAHHRDRALAARGSPLQVGRALPPRAPARSHLGGLPFGRAASIAIASSAAAPAGMPTEAAGGGGPKRVAPATQRRRRKCVAGATTVGNGTATTPARMHPCRGFGGRLIGAPAEAANGGAADGRPGNTATAAKWWARLVKSHAKSRGIAARHFQMLSSVVWPMKVGVVHSVLSVMCVSHDMLFKHARTAGILHFETLRNT